MLEEKVGPFCILRHGRKSHTWGELRDAAAHTSRDPAVPWLGYNIDPERGHLNEALVGSGNVVDDVRARLAAVGLEPKPGQVVARELLVTASHTYFAGTNHSGRDGDWDLDRLAVWKAETLKFLQAEFGDNLVTVAYHGDEAVPHAHVWVTTAVNVEKKGRGRPRKDGTRPASVLGWTLNHDKVMGSGKDAFSSRQDRYAEAMKALGLKRGLRFSRAHHQPIRQFYAELPQKLAAAEAERQAARELRLQAEQDAIRQAILAQAAAHDAAKAKEQQQQAELAQHAVAKEKAALEQVLHHARQAEQEQISVLEGLQAERDAMAGYKQQMRRFLDDKGLGRDFDIFTAAMQAVDKLRNGKTIAWADYEKSLRAYAKDLSQYGNAPRLRDIWVRTSEKHLKVLLETGAQDLGHSSKLRDPARIVSDGIMAWLQIAGGEPLLMLHRAVVRLVREAWGNVTELVVRKSAKQREER